MFVLEIEYMEHKDHFYLGYISKPIGNKGELSAILETDQPEAYSNLSVVFIDIQGSLIPYQIKKITIKGIKANIQLEDINDTEKASFISGCSLHLPLHFLPELSGKQFYYHEVIGFEVEDKTHGPIGIIENIIDQSSQAIFQINYKEKEVLIPVTDDFIRKVDRKKKQIIVDCPDGLIELYLSE